MCRTNTCVSSHNDGGKLWRKLKFYISQLSLFLLQIYIVWTNATCVNWYKIKICTRSSLLCMCGEFPNKKLSLSECFSHLYESKARAWLISTIWYSCWCLQLNKFSARTTEKKARDANNKTFNQHWCNIYCFKPNPILTATLSRCWLWRSQLKLLPYIWTRRFSSAFFGEMRTRFTQGVVQRSPWRLLMPLASHLEKLMRLRNCFNCHSRILIHKSLIKNLEIHQVWNICAW